MLRTTIALRPAAQPPLFFLAACLLVAAALAAGASPQTADPTPTLEPSIEGREPMDESDELQQGGAKREPMDESDELQQDGAKREPMDESDEIVAGTYGCAPRVRLEGRAAATLPPLFPAATRLVAVTLASDGWLAFARSGDPAGDGDRPARLLDARGGVITALDAGEPAWLTAGTYYLEIAAPAAGGAIELVAELE